MNVQPLSPRHVGLRSSEFNAVCSWPFADSYVSRLLASDIPTRVYSGSGRIWVYCDQGNEIVGFGSIDVCKEYGNLTDDKLHVYIPLLAVRPDKEGNGFGTAIVRHLVDEAAVMTCHNSPYIADSVLLDVYTTNTRAIGVYQKSDFQIIGEDFDDKEQKQYVVMARCVAVST